ncbi:MAG: hypothetical protein E7458_06815 [Ruminococcaceae bacterium]|nr:hypothetical protein [Oscillospiraceae bacterium]
MLDQLFLKLFEMSLSASVVILIVLLARLLLRRSSRVFSYLLWAVVLFRLLCPFVPESDFSLFPRFGQVSEHYTLSEQSISPGGAALAAYRAVGDAINGGLGTQHIRTTVETEDGMTQYVTAGWFEVWLLFGQYVWIVGTLVLLGIAGFRLWRLRRKLIGSIRQEGNLWISDQIDTAFVLGVLRPRIYLPAALDDAAQRCVIAHESCHLARRDPLWKLLAWLALCLHWMNPLVWLAFFLAGRDMEMSCDEAALRKLDREEWPVYAEVLLRLSVSNTALKPTPLAFGESYVKERIMYMVNWKKPKKWVPVLSVLLCIVVFAACAADRPAPNQILDVDLYSTNVGQGDAATCDPATCQDESHHHEESEKHADAATCDPAICQDESHHHAESENHTDSATCDPATCQDVSHHHTVSQQSGAHHPEPHHPSHHK